jgi:hypothetical protein
MHPIAQEALAKIEAREPAASSALSPEALQHLRALIVGRYAEDELLSVCLAFFGTQLDERGLTAAGQQFLELSRIGLSHIAQRVSAARVEAARPQKARANTSSAAPVKPQQGGVGLRRPRS